MTEKFTASNGIQVWIEHDRLAWDFEGHFAPKKDVTQAFREFFRWERDQELGRWRDPEDPNMVVNLEESMAAIYVRDEVTNTSYVFYGKAGVEKILAHPRNYTASFVRFAETALRYYKAHEPDPEWWSAKPGEVWVVEVARETHVVERVCQAIPSGKFLPIQEWGHQPSSFPVDDPRIAAARRIWPEPEGDES